MEQFSTSIDSPEEMEQFGRSLGRNLRGGETIRLSSDLGGGKTTLTRGIAAGAGSKDIVASPTFMVHKRYKTPLFTIEHFDFYRLPEPGMVADTLAEYVTDERSVVIIEWADSVESVLPDERVEITIDRTRTSESSRLVKVRYPASASYVFKDILTS